MINSRALIYAKNLFHTTVPVCIAVAVTWRSGEQDLTADWCQRHAPLGARNFSLLYVGITPKGPGACD